MGRFGVGGGAQTAAREYFLPFSEFPWFKEGTIADILAVEIEREHILHWPRLDVDLDIKQLDEPKRYPLVARGKKAAPLRVAEKPTTARYGSARARRVTR